MILFDISYRSYLLYIFIAFIVCAAGWYFIIWPFFKKHILIREKLRLFFERRNREIKQKNEELEKNNLIKTRLISIISHDLISPLKFIHMNTKNILENKDKMSLELQHEILSEVANSSKELELLSTNILNWIKYQNENRRLVKEEFDLHEMVNQIFSIFRGLARQKGITFVNTIHKGMILYQYMEPVRIVLYNLILNALNFTEKGSITITGGETKKGILIKVKDDGIGMTHEQINNILSEYFIVSSINVDKRKGNGLGYLIIKDLLKLVNAKFVIKSKKDNGTVVTIFLPI